MWRIILGVTLICAALSAKSADESLSIGEAQLTIGLERSMSWDLLKRYDLRCTGQEQRKQPPECNAWLVLLRTNQQYTPLGTVYFSEDGRISQVLKYYNQNRWSGEPEKFVSFLYEVLRQYGKNGEAAFVVSVAENRTPGAMVKSIDFHFGKKSVRVTHIDGGMVDGKSMRPAITLHEVLK